MEKHASAIQAACPPSTLRYPSQEDRAGPIWYGVTRTAPNVQRRGAELDALHVKVLASRERPSSSPGWGLTLITNLHGLGGVGKTTLAKMYVHEKHERFDGNVVWINEIGRAHV